jgi:putative ABC transport system ATP-binding protein
LIDVKNLSKIYGKGQSEFVALNDVNFSIQSGSTVAIIGKSGSGKSTLMHVMSGLDHPTSGSVSIDDIQLADMKKKAVDQFRANEMSFIFQAFFIEANQTCFQNVSLPLEIAGVPRAKRTNMIHEALTSVDLLDKVNLKAGKLSGGQKQRLAIARSIVNKPKLIFADEPTGNLDSATGDKIIELLFSLNKSLGATLVVVTHDEDLAKQCQVKISIKDGSVTGITNQKKATRKKAKK